MNTCVTYIRKSVVVLFFQFGVTSLFAQDYVPMLGDNNKWYQTYFFESAQTNEIICKDTITINSRLYKILYDHYYNSFGYIREDTAERKIYILYKNDSVSDEKVLYNFNLKVGDYVGSERCNSITTVSGYCYLHNESYYFTDNTIRRVFTFKNDTWIEGVGSVKYFIKDYSKSTYLNCFYKDDKHIMFSGLFLLRDSSCNINQGNVNTIKTQDQVEIFPNPFTKQITIKTFNERKSAFSIDITDILGKTVNLYNSSRFQGVFEQSFCIEDYSLNCGLILVRITKENIIEYHKALYLPE